MKKNNLKISIILIVSLLILYSIGLNTEVKNSVAKTSLSSPSNQVSLDDLIAHTPMTIDNDVDFETYSLPGDGSVGDPYRIENYNITTTGDYCLNFGGYTTKHFIIKNCFLKTDTNSAIFMGKYQNMADGTVDIYFNTIISTGNSGLRIDGGIDSGIYENNIISFDAGIDLVDSNFTYVHDNVIVSPYGIRTLNSPGVVINKNICNETTIVGIRVENSNGTIITHNNCSNNADTGIVVIHSENLTISNNYLINNFYGIRIMGSSGSLITNNNFTASTSYGLSMTLSVGTNKIYHNAFYDNNLAGTTVQALDDAGDQWYDEVLEEGNFWNDWSGSVSSTYTIDGSAGSEDPYPLGFVPEISEYTNGYLSYIMIAMFLAIPLVVYFRKRK